MLLAERNYVEKRDFIRMFIDARVEVIDVDNGLTHIGEAQTLSGRGLSFVAEFEPAMGARLNVTVASRQSRLPPLHAEFYVVRVIPSGGGRFEIAGELSNVS